MKNLCLRFAGKLAGLLVFMLVAGPALSTDFQNGEIATNNSDYSTALEKWKLLAEERNADAQFSLGKMYSVGNGVHQDYALAHMWVNLAASLGNIEAREYRDLIASIMSREQIFEAQGLAREWVDTHKK